MSAGQKQSGTVLHCSQTVDGRYLVVIRLNRGTASGYSDKPAVEGGTATISGGVVQ